MTGCKTFEHGSLWALFYGSLLVLAVYNLLIYMAVKERSYLYLCFTSCPWPA